MYSGVVILGLVHALVLAQEMQDNTPQHLNHVRFPAYANLFILTHLNIIFQNIRIKIIPNVRLLPFDYMLASVCVTLKMDHLR